MVLTFIYGGIKFPLQLLVRIMEKPAKHATVFCMLRNCRTRVLRNHKFVYMKNYSQCSFKKDFVKFKLYLIMNLTFKYGDFLTL